MSANPRRAPSAVVLLAVVLLAVGAFVAGAPRAAADDSPREAGLKLREALRAAPPSAPLTPNHPKDGPPEGEERLAVYLGLTRVGDLSLHTQIEEKGGEKLYVIEDRLDFDTPQLGNVHVLVTGVLGSDLSIRDLVLESEAPTGEGSVRNRRLAVAPKDGALWVTETHPSDDKDKPIERKLEGVDVRALLLTPPLGVGDRLMRLAKGDVGSRVSFDAFDLGRNVAASLSISFEEMSKSDIRGESVSVQKVSRDEGGAALESWLDPRTREALRIVRSDASAPRVTYVGREGPTRQDLPAPPPSARATEGPREAVLRFLRATSLTDPKLAEPEILASLEMDALFARATAKTPLEARDPRHTFERALVAILTSEEWRGRDELKRVLSGALTADDFAVEVTGDTAEVKAKDHPEAAGFELKKTDGGWKIVAFPGT